MSFTPMPHQSAMADRMAENEQWGFWHDTGTGKTIGSLMGLDKMREFPALVLAPKHVVKHAWLEDAKHFHGLRVIAAQGSKKKRDEAYRTVYNGDADVLVTNYESAIASKAAVSFIKWKTMILDESTRLKSHQTVTTRLLHGLAKRQPSARRFCLSGYPAPNSRQDLWGQVHFLKTGVFPTSFYAFRQKYFYQPNADHSWLWCPKQGSETEIDYAIDPISSWLRKDECLKLPSQIDVKHEVELSPVERRAYNKFIASWLLEFEDGDVKASSALIELMKCRQMTAGIVKRGDGVWEELGTSKLGVIKSLVESERGQVMIIGQFRLEIERIAAEFGDDARILYGGMGSKADDAITGFKRGDFKILVAHPGTMSHGLTFTNCSRMIFASLDHSYERYVQVRDRIHRYGQTKTCVYDHLQATRTVDQDIAAALLGKSQVTIDMIASAKSLLKEQLSAS